MGQFQDLKAQAAIIRDEQNSYQNTSLRVGRMFIDILEQLEKVLPDENVKPETLTVEATETSYKLKFSTLTSDGSVKSRELDLPIATDTKAGVMSPALMKGIKDQISQISLKVDSNKTDSDNKIIELEYTFNSAVLPISMVYTEQNGYLNSSGGYYDIGTTKSKTTKSIACKEGDIFLYKGKGLTNAVSALFRSDTTIVGKYIVNNTDSYSEIQIPGGVNNVIFSSYNSIDKDVILEVYKKGQYINGILIKDKSINGISLADNIGLYALPVYFGRYFDKNGGISKYFGGIASAQGITQLLALRPDTDFTFINLWRDTNTGQIIWFFDEDYNFIDFKRFESGSELIKNNIVCNTNDVIAVAPEGSKYFAVNTMGQLCVLRCDKSLIQPYDYLLDMKINKLLEEQSSKIDNISSEVTGGKAVDYVKNEQYKAIFDGYDFKDLEFTQIDVAIGSNWHDDDAFKIWASDYISVAEGDEFNVKGVEAKTNCNLVAFYDSNKNYVNRLISDGEEGIYGNVDINFTIPKGIRYIRAQNYTDISINTSSADYELSKKPKYDIEKKIRDVTSSSNVLEGKSWYCAGDSYSEGDFNNSPNPEDTKFTDGVYKGLNKVYSRFIALRNNMDLRLLAKCGATCGAWKEDVEAGTVDNPTNTNTFYHKQLPQILENEDATFKGYITLWFCINDTGHCTLGTIDDETVDTFYGALNWSAIQLITNFPLAKIGFIVSNNANSSYQQAVRDVAQKWAIPYLDMEGDPKVPTISGKRTNQDIPVDSRVRKLRWENNFRVASNNGHPNEKAHEYQSIFIENWLRSL